jgi:AraC-like DNA-binding protein
LTGPVRRDYSGRQALKRGMDRSIIWAGITAPKAPMKWSLSEFLNLVELRSQCWCVAELGATGGFSVPHNEAVLFYAMLGGTAKVADTAAGLLELQGGDIVMILSGDAHAVRCQQASGNKVLEFLRDGAYVDEPPTIMLGEGPTAARLLCGRLKVRWPGGRHPAGIPPIFRMKIADSVVNFPMLVRLTKGCGATAVLTRAATLLFIAAFRNHPRCEQIFRESELHDSVSHALQFIQTHPFQDWTVERLAKKVGMGRSSFAARFVAEIGKTPIEALTEERMKHAVNFLEKTDLKISEISERVGYRSEAAFSRRFTSCFGMSPGKIRKNRRHMRMSSVVPDEQAPSVKIRLEGFGRKSACLEESA